MLTNLHASRLVAVEDGLSQDRLSLQLLGRDMHAEDHKFLDNLIQKQNQVDAPDTDLLAAAAENVPKAGMNGSGDGSAPRAESVNNNIVKRAELVNRGGTVKRAELVRRR